MTQITIDCQTFQKLVNCAAAHIDDVESGLKEGYYKATDNPDLDEKKDALRLAVWLLDPPEAPEGGYFIMIDHEQTADHRDTLTEARKRGQEMCDEEIVPTTWSIHDAQGQFVESITRTDGKDLAAQIKEFNAMHA